MDETIPLHEQRYNEMRQKQAERLRAAIEANMLNNAMSLESDNPASQDFNSKIGKSIFFKPLVYYSLPDCIVNCKKMFKTQATSNIEKVREARSKRGQILTKADELNKVKGQVRDSHKAVNPLRKEGVTFHHVVDKWCDTVCIFNVAESWFGHGKMKRRGYEMISVDVFFWLKKGGSVGSEKILKRRFFYMAKKASQDANKVN